MLLGFVCARRLQARFGRMSVRDPGRARRRLSLALVGNVAPQPHFNGSEDAETRAAIQSMRDYRIVGPDAVRTADIANMVAINSSRFIYDLPEPGRDALLAKINQGASTNGLDAHVEQEPTRVPHRVRAQRAADLGGGDFLMEGPV